MSDWIVSQLPNGEVEVTCSDRTFPAQQFFDLPEVPAITRAFCFIEEEFNWGDRILTREQK